jgi:hypothetical protein
MQRPLPRTYENQVPEKRVHNPRAEGVRRGWTCCSLDQRDAVPMSPCSHWVVNPRDELVV